MNGKMIPLVWGVVIGSVGIWSIFGMTSWFKYVVGPVCLLAGWHSLKAAVFMTDEEVNKVNSGMADQKTQRKFEDL
jgi:hypothetical protein